MRSLTIELDEQTFGVLVGIAQQLNQTPEVCMRETITAGLLGVLAIREGDTRLPLPIDVLKTAGAEFLARFGPEVQERMERTGKEGLDEGLKP
jgi:hypothetical protein